MSTNHRFFWGSHASTGILAFPDNHEVVWCKPPFGPLRRSFDDDSLANALLSPPPFRLFLFNSVKSLLLSNAVPIHTEGAERYGGQIMRGTKLAPARTSFSSPCKVDRGTDKAKILRTGSMTPPRRNGDFWLWPQVDCRKLSNLE